MVHLGSYQEHGISLCDISTAYGICQLAGQDPEERTPTRIIIVLQGKIYLEKYDVL